MWTLALIACMRTTDAAAQDTSHEAPSAPKLDKSSGTPDSRPTPPTDEGRQGPIAGPGVREGTESGPTVSPPFGVPDNAEHALALLRELNRKSENAAVAKVSLDYGGTTLSLGEVVGGSPTVIHLISMPCGPCEVEWPAVVAAGSKLENLGVNLLVVALATGPDMPRLEARYRSLVGPTEWYPNVYFTPNSTLTDSLSVSMGTPATIIVDQHLGVVRKWTGSADALWHEPMRTVRDSLGLPPEKESGSSSHSEALPGNRPSVAGPATPAPPSNSGQ